MAVSKTPYKWNISLKKTAKTDKISPIPKQKINNKNSGIILKKIFRVIVPVVYNFITKRAGIVNNKFTLLDTTLESGKIYLGTYTFLIKYPFSIIELIENVVDSEKKVNNIWPDIKYKI